MSKERICEEETVSSSFKSNERICKKIPCSSGDKSKEKVGELEANSLSFKSNESNDEKEVNTCGSEAKERISDKEVDPSGSEAKERISDKEVDPCGSDAKERISDKEINPSGSVANPSTNDKESYPIIPNLTAEISSVLIESDISETPPTDTVRSITVRDLGGVYDTVVPIADWNRYLDIELALFKVRMEKKKIKFSSRKEFKFITEIGRGSYGRVALVIKRDSGRYYAAKFISRKVLRRKEIKKYVMNERNIMYSIRFTFTVYLEYFIQDSMNLYFILPVALGGNLDSLIKNNGKLSENSAKFYAAQIVLALEYLHYMSIIYRDLKPGNILLDHFGFIKLTDFGFSKILKVDRTYTMCGTAEYLAPEIILGHGYNLAADWWSFGVVIYELCTGYTPFYARFKPQLFNRITTVDYYCPNYFTDSIQMLLWNIFQLDIERRFGTRIGHGVQDIKDHDWFSKIHWLLLANRRIDPPYLPVVNLHISSQCPSTSLSME